MFAHTILISLALLAPAVSAVGYKGYSSTTQCSGDNFFCQDGGNTCCRLPAAYGFSAVWDNLPVASKGQAYRDNGCVDFIAEVQGSGTKCWNGGGTQKAGTLNWFFTARKALVVTECTPPMGFGYSDAEGNYREIKVPQGGMNISETISELYAKRDYVALAAYETY